MRPAAALGLVRPFTLLAPTVGVLCGSAVAAARLSIPYAPLAVTLAALSAALATGASNAWNQAFDADIDRENKPERPVPSGRATVRGALVLGTALAAASLAVAALVRPEFLACVGFGIATTWVYSAPPLRTKRHPVLANLTIALPRGFLVPVAGWAVLASPRGIEPFALGLVPGLFVLGAASTKDFADVEGDRRHGCRTLPVLLGPARAARIVAPFLVAPFALYPLLAALGWLSRPLWAWAVLATVLTTLGALTARALLADPARLATERNHPAWRGMYLLLLGQLVGTAIVYLA